MDSLTQIFLGASVGMLTGGKKLGNKAALWGAIGGTIPDLDVLLGLIYDPVSYLMIHRGFSHSVFFAPLTAPLIALIPWFIYGRDKFMFKTWATVFFWSLFTHPFLDLFTGYGTQLLNPISNYGFEINSLFIIDPIYTSVLGFFLIKSMKKTNFETYSTLVKKGLIYSSLYILLTVGLKLYTQHHIRIQAQNQGIEIKSMMTIPGPFTSFLWRGLIDSGDGFYQTYFSVFDSKSTPLEFQFESKSNPYPDEFIQSRAVKTLEWFSKGFQLVEYDSKLDEFNAYDLRFGTVKGWDGDYSGYVFTFHVSKDLDGQIVFEQRPNAVEITRDDLVRLFLRTFSIHE